MASSLRDEVEQLLQIRRYDPDIVPRLQEFVDEQISTGEFEADANLALLKLYQFYPDLHNQATTAKILTLALTAMPSTDFLCAQYLIPERFQSIEPIPKLVTLLELLEGGKFVDFWVKRNASKDVIPAVAGFNDSIREFMFGVISHTYIRITEEDVKSLLNLSSDELTTFLAKHKLQSIDGSINLPPTKDNQPKPTTVTEQISFSDIAPTLFKAL